MFHCVLFYVGNIFMIYICMYVDVMHCICMFICLVLVYVYTVFFLHFWKQGSTHTIMSQMWLFICNGVVVMFNVMVFVVVYA